MRYIIAVLLTLALSVPALAAAPDSKAGPTPVAQLQDRQSGDAFILEGQLMPATGKGEANYFLQDNTGSIAVKIDPSLVTPAVTPTTTVRVSGYLNVLSGSDRILQADTLTIVQ